MVPGYIWIVCAYVLSALNALGVMEFRKKACANTLGPGILNTDVSVSLGSSLKKTFSRMFVHTTSNTLPNISESVSSY